jgi:hypothetical protein
MATQPRSTFFWWKSTDQISTSTCTMSCNVLLKDTLGTSPFRQIDEANREANLRGFGSLLGLRNTRWVSVHEVIVRPCLGKRVPLRRLMKSCDAVVRCTSLTGARHVEFRHRWSASWRASIPLVVKVTTWCLDAHIRNVRDIELVIVTFWSSYKDIQPKSICRALS